MKTIEDLIAYLKKRNVEFTFENGKITVSGSLYLRSLTSLPDNAQLSAGGYLDLGSLTSLPDNAQLSAGGYLDLGSLTSLPDNAQLSAGGYLYLGSLTSLPDNAQLSAGGSLDLGSLTSLPDNAQLSAGGSLYLGSLTSLPDKYFFYYRRIICGFNTKPTIKQLPIKKVDTAKDFFIEVKGEKRCIVDRIQTKVISERHLSNGMTLWYVKKFGCEVYLYIAGKDRFFAHGESSEKAIADCLFKIASYKLKHETINLDTGITVQHYRAVTGSCDAGVRDWLSRNSIPFKVIDGNTVEETPMKVADLLPLLERTNAYGLEKFKSLITAQ